MYFLVVILSVRAHPVILDPGSLSRALKANGWTVKMS